MSTDSGQDAPAAAPTQPAEPTATVAPASADPSPPAAAPDHYGIWMPTESIRASEPPPRHTFDVETKERRG